MRKTLLFSSGILAIALLTSCKTTEIVETKPDPIVPSIPVVVVEPSDYVSKIEEMVVNSDIAKYKWKDRSIAPKGYLKGMALVYARSICKPSQTVSSAVLGTDSKDALAYYKIKASNKNTYALLIGLGMRESSGKYCTGRDATASNVKAIEAEAGLFQTSYNSSASNKELPELMKDYSRRCYLEQFNQGVACPASDWKYWGDSTSTGYLFQRMAKTCPAFAAEYAAITLRSLRLHYGPINRKEVEFKNEVVDLLTNVEKFVGDNPKICDVL